MEVITGRVWKFGDNVDTDVIVPGQYLDAPMEEVLKHVFESVYPGFVKEVKQGDVIVAGKNFGCGSSRENAPAALKELGVGCIIAESFARIIFRNAVAIGLPVISCSNVSKGFADGDGAVVRLSEALVENTTKNISLSANHLSDEMLKILNRGGIIEMLIDELGKAHG